VTKIAGSGAESGPVPYPVVRYMDPRIGTDPHLNVMDPEHWNFVASFFLISFVFLLLPLVCVI
jgi:hypothetical protein